MPEDLVQLLHEDVMTAVSEEELFSDIFDSYNDADTLDPLARTLYSDYSTVADFYLRRNDLNRSLGLETRYPFFDVKLVELCARVPSRLKIKGWFDTKYIMKKAVEPWLPREIVYRKDKLGHSIPLKNWIRDHPYVKEFVGDLLSQDRLRRRGLVNPEFVKKMWDDHMAMNVNNSHRLWSLAVIELWFDKHAHVRSFSTGNS
jgi:asparagine synthase (glutamine-hydrolysing)